MSAVASRIRLPQGELDLSESPAIRMRLRVPRQLRTAVMQSLDQLSKFDPDRFLRPSLLAEEATDVEVTFVPDGEGVQLLPQYLDRHKDPAERIPVLLHLARFLTQSGKEPETPLLPLSPALVCISPERDRPWRLLPVPAPGLSLADWATADPQTWSWVDRSTLFGRPPPDSLALVGMMFVAAFSDQAAVPGLTAERRFRRMLSGRRCSFSSFEAAIRGALPKSFDEEAAALVGWVKTALELACRQRTDWPEGPTKLAELSQSLSFERLISRWNYELQPEIARRLGRVAEELSERPKPAPPPPANLGGMALPEPLAAMLRALPSEGPGMLRRYLSAIVDLAARGGESIALARSALEQLSLLDQANPMADVLDETARVEIAHIQVRYLGVDAELLPVLRQAFESNWNRAVCLALRARALAKTDEYVRISNYCKQGRALVESAPQRGGPAGTYLRSYFDLLDGIAHIGGAAKLHEFSFYADAFDLLSKSWQEANEVAANDLSEAAVRWIAQLSKSTRLLNGTRWYVVHVAIEAWFRAIDLIGDLLNKTGVTQPPWYDERRVFPM